MLGFLNRISISSIIYSLPAIIISLSFHEWAHAYAAYRCGDPTARNMGRMTLNPSHHIDIMGLICLILFRFGWAKPVPVNPRNFNNMRRDDIIVSLAGVASNLSLALFTMLVIYISGITVGFHPVLGNLLYYFLFVNIGLMVFNLIPVPPLDGYHVFQNALINTLGPRPFLYIQNYSNYFLIGILLLNAYTGFLSNIIFGIVMGLRFLFDGIFSYGGLDALLYSIRMF